MKLNSNIKHWQAVVILILKTKEKIFNHTDDTLNWWNKKKTRIKFSNIDWIMIFNIQTNTHTHKDSRHSWTPKMIHFVNTHGHGHRLRVLDSKIFLDFFCCCCCCRRRCLPPALSPKHHQKKHAKQNR